MLFGYFFHQSTDLVVSYHPMKSQSSNDYFGDVILDLRKAIAITTIIETIDRKGINEKDKKDISVVQRKSVEILQH